MSRNPVTYQQEDRAILRGRLLDPALDTALKAVTSNWRGFRTSLEDFDRDDLNVEPRAPGGAVENPVAFGVYLLQFGPTNRALSGDVLPGRRGTLSIWLSLQPQLSGEDLLEWVDRLWRPIKTFLNQRNTVELNLNISLPWAQVREEKRNWPRFRWFAPVWS